MSKEETSIGQWLYLSILIIPTFGYGLMNMPYHAAAAMGANGYLAEPFSIILILPGLAAIYLLAKRYVGKNLIEQGRIIIGPVAGSITGLLYLGFNIIMLSVFTRDIANLTSSYYLPQTPTYIIMIFFFLMTVYLSSRGIETIARINAFVMLPTLLGLVIVLILGYQNFGWTHVLPIASPKPGDYIKGMTAIMYIYYLLGASAMTLPFLKPQRSFPRLAGGTLLFLGILYFFFAAGAIGVFGHKALLRYAWPSLEFVHTLDFPYILMEQVGLVMLIIWLIMFLVGTGYLFYVISLGSAYLSGVWDYKRWVYLLFPVILVLGMLPKNVSETKVIFNYIAGYGWLFLFGYPVFLLLWAVIFEKRRVDSAA